MIQERSRLKVIQFSLVFVGLISLLVLTGWLFDVRLLKSVLPQLVTMKANTALCLGLTAIAIWLSRTTALRRHFFIAVWILTALISFTATATLCEYFFHWNVGIDELLFRDPGPFASQFPGRFAPGSGVCFLLFSFALLCLNCWPRFSHSLTLGVALVAMISLVGYAYNLPIFFVASRYTSLALHTVVSFLALSVAMLAVRPNVGLTGVLLDSWREGSSTPVLITGAILSPILLGCTALTGERLGWYGSDFTLALYAVMLITFSVSLVWWTGNERRQLETKRQQAEKALRESEERFRTMADNIPNLAWMAHADGSIFWYNQRWYSYTGTTLEQMEGWGWTRLHDPEVLPAVMEQWKVAIKLGAPFEMVFPLRGANGVFCSFLTRIQPVKGEDGRVVRWFGTNTDISAERRTQEELRKANRELEEYAYVSSHDLQEPLRMVNLNSQLLMREIAEQISQGQISGNAKKYAGGIQLAVTQMSQLINDLLQFSRTVDSGTSGDINIASADLNVCLRSALTSVDAAVQETEAVITATHLPFVAGEEIQLTQLFQNLISNSLKYRSLRERSEISISAREERGDWVISVKDNGIGFEQRYAERIFGLFKRLHRESYPGTGLGLAICQRIVERSGGRIWAEGSPGNGATFHFQLPAGTLNNNNKKAPQPTVEALPSSMQRSS